MKTYDTQRWEVQQQWMAGKLTDDEKTMRLRQINNREQLARWKRKNYYK